MCPECLLSIAMLLPGAVSTGGVTLAAVSILRRQKTAASTAARRKAADAGSPLSGFAAAGPKNRKEMAAGKMFYNYKVQSYPIEEGHGLSAFYQDATGDIFHTYSTYGRGVEAFINTYHLLDLAPKGRDEQDQKPHPMAWVRHHDKYQGDCFADRPARPAERAAGQPGSPAHDCCRDS